MVRLAAILILLVMAGLAPAGYTVFAHDPPEQGDGIGATSGKDDSGISQLLLDSISQRGIAIPQQEVDTTDPGTSDTATKEAGALDQGVGVRSVTDGAQAGEMGPAWNCSAG